MTFADVPVPFTLISWISWGLGGSGAVGQKKDFRKQDKLISGIYNYMRKLEIRIGEAHCSWYSFHSENNK